MNTSTLALLQASPTTTAGPRAAMLVALHDDGTLTLDLGGGSQVRSQWLQAAAEAVPTLAPGDRLLALEVPGAGWVTLGRIGPYRAPQTPEHLVLQAGSSVALQCGESSLTLHADGKVLLKGDDVVVRAKGTQRIRAGHVAIN